MKRSLIGAMLLIQAGCASQFVDQHIEQHPFNPELVASPYLDDAARSKSAEQASQELMEISAELRQYLDEWAVGETPEQRFSNVLKSLRKHDFQLSYDLDDTLTASDAFTQRRGNCISFAALIVTVARDVGLEANFNRVQFPIERFSRKGPGGGTYVQNVLHVNTIVHYENRKDIIELNFLKPVSERIKEMSDDEATAMYLNNLAMHAMSSNRVSEAFHFSRTALELDEDASYLWSGLGSVYRRAGDLGKAEESYSHALRLDKRNGVALRNLKRVHDALGDDHARELANRTSI